jgi:hypothetical protein
VAAAELFLQLTDEDFAACRYHQADWKTLSELSLHLLAAEDRWTAWAELDLDNRLDDHHREWLRSLFEDPIVWDEGQDHLTNGAAPSVCTARRWRSRLPGRWAAPARR